MSNTIVKILFSGSSFTTRASKIESISSRYQGEGQNCMKVNGVPVSKSGSGIGSFGIYVNHEKVGTIVFKINKAKNTEANLKKKIDEMIEGFFMQLSEDTPVVELNFTTFVCLN